MTIDYGVHAVRLHQVVGVEEAEGLLEWLQGEPTATVDLSDCTHLHPANLQVLMAAQVPVTAWPADAGLGQWLQSALGGQRPRTDATT
jgi:hypothetical protein